MARPVYVPLGTQASHPEAVLLENMNMMLLFRHDEFFWEGTCQLVPRSFIFNMRSPVKYEKASHVIICLLNQLLA